MKIYILIILCIELLVQFLKAIGEIAKAKQKTAATIFGEIVASIIILGAITLAIIFQSILL